MKNGKRPKVRQKKLMTQNSLDCDKWLVVKDTPTEMVIVHRDTSELKTIPK